MENINIDTIIESITCPITQMPMKDPVQGKDGHTYERHAIVTWLNEKHISPQTREHMTINDLKVNAAIRFLCDKYHAGEFGAINNQTNVPPKVLTHNIIVDHKISKSNNSEYISLDFDINKESMPKDLESGHLSQDIVLVIDRSGSMNMNVEAKDADGNNFECGLSIQDIVNHAAKTVAKTLDKSSRLSVVAFDNEIVVIFDLMFMSELNKSQALSKIDNIRPRNQTNIWGGIEKAIEILDNRDDKSRNSAILMLTDGMPNISPARGEIDTLKKLRNKKNFTAPIYTFGFGYSLKPELLYDMAKYGNGGNGHISDGGMIATVFCNFTGTILCTVVNNLQLHIDNPEISLMGDYASSYDSNKEENIFDIGTIQYEQMRTIILNIPININTFNYYYTYKIGGTSYSSNVINVIKDEVEKSDIINIHINRYKLVESIRKMINFNRTNQNSEAIKEYTNIHNTLINSKLNDPLTQGMLKNLNGNISNEGQIKIATHNISYFKRWGEFYLDQLSRSLNQQIKPNFKDEACLFGGTIFSDCVDRASDIFDNLPPPKPSLLNQTNVHQGGNYRGLSTSTNISHVPVNMSLYNNPGNGCFDSNCLITMADGSKKVLKNLKKDDIIMSSTLDNIISTAKVVCVIEIKITMGIREFVDFEGGLYITPWHPIKYNNEWVFPHNIKAPIIKQCNSIITLVLDNHHIGFINDFQCIMLGHGFKNSVLKHEYYGTQKVINDLKQHYGYNNGHILINDYDLTFYKNNDSVSKVLFNKTTEKQVSLVEEVH